MHRLEAQAPKQPHLQANLAIGLREIARLEPLVQGLFLALPGLPSMTKSGPQRKRWRLLIMHLLILFFLFQLGWKIFFSRWIDDNRLCNRRNLGQAFSVVYIIFLLAWRQDLRSSLAALVFRPFFVQSFLCPHALFACLAAHFFFFFFFDLSIQLSFGTSSIHLFFFYIYISPKPTTHPHAATPQAPIHPRPNPIPQLKRAVPSLAY